MICQFPYIMLYESYFKHKITFMNINAWITSGHMCYMMYNMSIGPRRPSVLPIFMRFLQDTSYKDKGMGDFPSPGSSVADHGSISHMALGLIMLLTVWLPVHPSLSRTTRATGMIASWRAVHFMTWKTAFNLLFQNKLSLVCSIQESLTLTWT